MSEKWTPGPLEVREVHYLCESIPTTFEVSNPLSQHWACHALTIDDARLYSAAPDLYAACQAMASCAGDGSASFSTARKMARAAIKKARGEA